MPALLHAILILAFVGLTLFASVIAGVLLAHFFNPVIAVIAIFSLPCAVLWIVERAFEHKKAPHQQV